MAKKKKYAFSKGKTSRSNTLRSPNTHAAIDAARKVRDHFAPKNPDAEKHPELKGVEGGNCNRSACQMPGADYYNLSTQKYYCRECAYDIQDFGNRCGDIIFEEFYDEAMYKRVQRRKEQVERVNAEKSKTVRVLGM